MTLAPAAMIAAAVSCRARWNSMPASSNPSISVTTSPPGMPKACRTPCRCRVSATRSATRYLVFRSLPLIACLSFWKADGSQAGLQQICTRLVAAIMDAQDAVAATAAGGVVANDGIDGDAAGGSGFASCPLAIDCDTFQG